MRIIFTYLYIIYNFNHYTIASEGTIKFSGDSLFISHSNLFVFYSFKKQDSPLYLRNEEEKLSISLATDYCVWLRKNRILLPARLDLIGWKKRKQNQTQGPQMKFGKWVCSWHAKFKALTPNENKKLAMMRSIFWKQLTKKRVWKRFSQENQNSIFCWN